MKRIQSSQLGNNRASGGYRAQKSGGANEKKMDEEIHKGYAEAGRALIVMQNVPTVVVDSRGLRQCKGKAPCDFMGTLRDGRSLVMELKSTTKRAASLPVSESGISLQQIDALLRHHEMNALVVVVWRNADMIGVLFADGLIEARDQYGEGEGKRKSIPHYRFKWVDGWDWLSILDGGLS